MTLAAETSPNKTTPKTSYDVLLENQADGTVKATLFGLPEYQVLGVNKEEAIQKLSQLLQERKPEIITLEIEPPPTEHPWMKFAGMFKDDSQFDEVLEYIEEYRNELDAEMEEYYQQMDAEDETK